MSRLAYQARRATGLSQRAFARLIEVHPATVARWESGTRRPTATARALLRLIASRPDVCVAVLARRGAGHASPPRAG